MRGTSITLHARIAYPERFSRYARKLYRKIDKISHELPTAHPERSRRMQRAREKTKLITMINDFFLYILKCNDNSYYVGHTDNIEKRLAEHALGMSRHTAKRLPITLLHLESFQTRDEAFYAERKIKGWSRKKKEAYIQKNFKKLHELAKCYNQTYMAIPKSSLSSAASFDSAQDERC